MKPKSRLFLKRIRSVGLVDKGACEGADILIFKRDDNADPTAGIAAEVEKIGAKLSRERKTRLMKALEELKAALAGTGGDEEEGMAEKSEKKVAKVASDTPEEPTPEPTPEPAPEPTPEVTKAAIPEDVQKRLNDLEKRAKDAEDIAKAERDARLEAEEIRKAESFKALTIDPQKWGPIMKRARQTLSAEDMAEVERVLKAADEAVAQSGILTVKGVRGEDEQPSAWNRIEKAAEEIRKADSKLTQPQAIAKVLREQPKLYAEYQAERGGAH